MLNSSFDPPSGDVVVKVRDLRIAFRQRDAAVPKNVVTDVSFELRKGQITALIGESGSGKSVTAKALVGLNGDRAIVTASQLDIHGKPALSFTERDWHNLRGRHVGLVLQDALTSLDPLRSLEKELLEPLAAHQWGTRSQRQDRIRATLRNAGLPDVDSFLPRRPDEMSGGQRQRALIGQATVLNPPILIADEPTTALDSTVQAQILDLLETFRDRGHAILLISHDLGVVSRLADTVHVMKDGNVIESGSVDQILRNPQTAYTRRLIDAVPDPENRRSRLYSYRTSRQVVDPRRPSLTPDNVVEKAVVAEVDGLCKSFISAGGVKTTALDSVSFSVRQGETVGIVGESGSGKSTLSWIIAGLRPFDSGSLRLFGQTWDELRGAAALDHRRNVQIVYQDPAGSFDPRHNVGQLLIEALIPDRSISAVERSGLAERAMHDVHLSTDLWHRNPLTLSGGQRQRLAIARALVTGAKMLIFDEPVSALDATIQAQILDLIQDLRERRELSSLFVSHDLGVVHHVSDSILVMRAGKIIERGTADQIFFDPMTDYARALVSAVPRLHSSINSIL